MRLFKTSRAKKQLSATRVLSAVLVLGVLVLFVAESAKYLYVIRVPKSVSSQISKSVDKLTMVLGAAKTSLEGLEGSDEIQEIAVHDEKQGRTEKREVVARIGILADAHDDLESLEKALLKAEHADVTQIIFLGDYTSYGDLNSLQQTKKVMDAAQIDYVSLPGDHDVAQTRDTSNFTKVYGDTYGTFELDNINFMYFDNSKNFTSIGDSAMAWFEKELSDIDFLFLSQPLMSHSMSRVMGIIDGVKEEAVFAQNRRLLTAVRNSNVKVIVAGDLHTFSKYQDPEKAELWHYTAGAVLPPQSELEKIYRQAELPEIAVLTIFSDQSYEISQLMLD
ncbi:metallophosphoesterase family protein [Patescibacteria group bacterium]|nr:metallophosphoesterase family protein [Patescibacteria group bacterium]MBU1970654.1 metallophosphoesterase family protein [Patescibacteria group bacterium]